ncbi:CYTH and CHAD domain-containing protein [Streptomyces sp. SP18CS02]|uniref:CYTH and CHAD domain-containing protein n=1 Tax=Streptomyces sp. SP18CS02 TaxID=3002531 RepID=UPI002E777C95|nr:CYTH and CHAD domain-containing protein [Streptomyces sp. SP18CS02]MEE1753606.1 CYTH and CHAD domain-containing protein [Streptomyces sp. SP18CS02]
MTADTKREIERKYEATPGGRTPDLTRVPGVSDVVAKGVVELDAVYYDTTDLRLAAAGITLRRRTGGEDAGWHLKLPVAPHARDEIHAPLGEGDDVPPFLAALVRARTRDRALVPLVRLRTARDVHHLVDGEGRLLAEVSTDAVRARRLTDDRATVRWTEIEVELGDGTDPAFLDAVDKRLRKAGTVPSEAPSKLARALAETGRAPEPAAPAGPPDDRATAGDHVLAFVREQVEALLGYDAAVRRDLPDSVHRMRVATRRLRSAFRTFRKVLDREVTDPLGEELKWLAAELGVSRDQEVLTERLTARIEALPAPVLLGPVRGRLRAWSTVRGVRARERTLAALNGDRYLALLGSLDALLAAPPLRPAARKAPAGVLAKAVLKDHDRLAGRITRALSLPAGKERDLALHEARKAAKRERYAAEAARPALGRPAKRLSKRIKAVQKVLGDHQDSVVAREELRNLAIQAHSAGETSFTWGLLHGQEEALAAECERKLPHAWEKASRGRTRADLEH